LAISAVLLSILNYEKFCVEPTSGLEPPTSSLPRTRSTN
jgi:hypothetical protein